MQEGIPAAIPVDFCYQGWQESLEMLAKLVEPEIPDGARTGSGRRLRLTVVKRTLAWQFLPPEPSWPR